MTDYGAPPVSDNARAQVRVLGMLRAVVGGAMVLAPATSMRFWIGEERKAFGTRLVTRALGMREIAIGVGTILAVDHDAPVRGWLEAGGLIDSSDAFTTPLSYPKLPPVGRKPRLARRTTAP